MNKKKHKKKINKKGRNTRSFQLMWFVFSATSLYKHEGRKKNKFTGRLNILKNWVVFFFSLCMCCVLWNLKNPGTMIGMIDKNAKNARDAFAPFFIDKARTRFVEMFWIYTREIQSRFLAKFALYLSNLS